MSSEALSLKDLRKGTQSSVLEGKSDSEIIEQTNQEMAVKTKNLSPEDREKVDKIKSTINLMDHRLAIDYGVGAQSELSAFSDTVLNSVRNRDSGEVGTLLISLMDEIKGLEIDKLDSNKSFLSRLPFVSGAERKLEKVFENYETVDKQIEKIQSQLDIARVDLIKNIAVLEELFDRNVDYFKELQYYIIAGEEAIEETRQEVIPRLREEALATGDQMDAQLVKDFENTLNRFEKKVHDLKLTRTMSIQTAPQIRLIQNNDRLLVDKIQTSILNTIPLWKSQIVMAIGLSRQEKVLNMQREVSNTTNELLRRNSELLKHNTIGVLEESERGIIDLETLKEVNKDLIETIEEGIRIQEEGRQKRISAEKELIEMEERLKNTLLKSIGPSK